VIAIDENVRATLPDDLQVDVIHNVYTPTHAPVPDRAILGKLAPLRPTSLKIGFIGNLHLSKGIFDLLDAAVLVRQARRDVEFVVVGGVTMSDKGMMAWLLDKLGLAQNVQARLVERIEQLGLVETFHLLGPTSDIQCVYESIDVLCFPSHFNAPGRPVFEAAFSSVPSIVAVSRPLPDTVVDGETGLAIPGKDPAKLAEAIVYFADNRAEVARMGKNARQLAERNHDPRANARRLLDVYTRVVHRASQ
jgi:glycosyltransferase involved in cell wall biosynthesis